MNENHPIIDQILATLNEVGLKIQKIAESQDRTDAILAKTESSMAKTDVQIKEISKQIGGIATSNGYAAETLITNTLSKTLTLNGWTFDYAEPNVKKYVKALNIKDQYDLVLGKDNLIVIVEIKYRIRSQDVIELKNRKIPNYKKLFPNETRNIVGVVAGISIEDEALKDAKKNGIYAITLSGKHIKVENEYYEEFV